MKNLKDYLTESEFRTENPDSGDTFAINLREECLVESRVIESMPGAFCVAADDKMLSILESYGVTFEDTGKQSLNEAMSVDDTLVSDRDMSKTKLAESHFAVGDRVQCRKSGMKGRIVKLDKDHGAADDQYYTVKRDDGQLRKMAPKDMTKLDEQVMRLDHDRPEPDPGEYDQEGDMAKNELYTMIRSARKLIGMLDNNDNMPEWTQKKINKATDYVDSAADYISSQKERGVMEQSQEDSPVARATLHRIMMRHPGMLAQHGPERVMQAVDDVADLVGDMDDIGSSDISGWVNMVQEILDSQDQGVAEGSIDEAEYQGREVSLGKPMQGDVKKFKVYVKDPSTGNIKKVNFGDPNMKIRKSNPGARKSFRARHNCDNPGPRTKARYWSCRKW